LLLIMIALWRYSNWWNRWHQDVSTISND